MRGQTKVGALQWSLIAILSAALIEGLGGLLTNSLAILSDAAHAFLDAVTTALLLLTTKWSLRPPDESHAYGHGKIESIGGLIGGVAIFGASLAIFWEAGLRLLSGQAPVRTSPFGYGALLYTFSVDLFRIAVLTRSGSAAGSTIRANLYHAFGDLSSTVVALIGFSSAAVGAANVDVYASVVLGFSLAFLSSRLVYRSSLDLSDSVPTRAGVSRGLVRRLEEEVRGVDGVLDCHRVRLRCSGDRTFADMHVLIDEKTPLELAHKIASSVEERARRLIPGADIVVHMEPSPKWEEDLAGRIRDLASSMPKVKGVHNILLRDIHGKLYVKLHLELEGSLTLKEAHETSTQLEERVEAEMPGVAGMVTHLEPVREIPMYGEDVTQEAVSVAKEARDLALEVEGVKDVHDIVVRRVGDSFEISMHCDLDEGLSLDEVHAVSNHIERHVIERVKGVAHILVHVEPSVAPSSAQTG
ncbi:MAG: cation-efflux pump [Candidatus Bathyarchaeia archaeon]